LDIKNPSTVSAVTVEPIVCQVVIDRGSEAVFRCFTERFGERWPQDYTFSKQSLCGMYFGHGVGHWCYEQGLYGFRCDWGRIFAWSPPIAFTWQIGPKSILQPDPDQCTEVHVQFADDSPGSSRVTLSHRYFERHGADAAAYLADMASHYGWHFILQEFAAAARG
jgi:hypothetical protein